MCVVGIMSFLFLSLVVSGRVTSYSMKSLSPSGPNIAQSPDLKPIVASSKEYVLNHENKMFVSSYPNLEKSHDPVLVVARSKDSDFRHEIKRRVPLGPNPMEPPMPVPTIESSFVNF